MSRPVVRALGRVALTAAEVLGVALLVSSVIYDRPAREILSSETSKSAPLSKMAPSHGRFAQSPRQIPMRGWKDILIRAGKEIGEDHVMLIAAGVTFYILLALFPALVSFVSLYGLLANATDAASHAALMGAFLPPAITEFIRSELARIAEAQSAELGWTFAIGLIVSLWSANGAAKAMFLGMNIAYDEREKRSIISLNLASFGFTLGLLAAALLAAGALAVIPLANVFGFLSSAAASLRWPLQWIVALVGFSLLYRFGPSRTHARWRWLSWGSAVAALVWVAASAAFSFYVSQFANLDVSYGSLAAVIGFAHRASRRGVERGDRAPDHRGLDHWSGSAPRLPRRENGGHDRRRSVMTRPADGGKRC
jgi:membrane protein